MYNSFVENKIEIERYYLFTIEVYVGDTLNDHYLLSSKNYLQCSRSKKNLYLAKVKF